MSVNCLLLMTALNMIDFKKYILSAQRCKNQNLREKNREYQLAMGLRLRRLRNALHLLLSFRAEAINKYNRKQIITPLYNVDTEGYSLPFRTYRL